MTPVDLPKIIKTPLIKGRTINLRDATVGDAHFIFNLRHNPNRNRYISPISKFLEDQIKWLKKYTIQDIGECYFIIENKDGDSLGTVRLYDQQRDSFCWGSWVLKENAPKTASIESILMIYQYAFDVLKFKQSHFDVRKDNTKVFSFYKSLGAKITNEDNLNYYLILTYKDWGKISNLYSKFLKKV